MYPKPLTPSVKIKLLLLVCLDVWNFAVLFVFFFYYLILSFFFLEWPDTYFSMFQKSLPQVLVFCRETRWQNCVDHWGQFWYR